MGQCNRAGLRVLPPAVCSHGCVSSRPRLPSSRERSAEMRGAVCMGEQPRHGPSLAPYQLQIQGSRLALRKAKHVQGQGVACAGAE